MKCQACSKPATVHLTDLVNGKKKETHLCQECAEQQQLVKQHDLNLPAILEALLGQHVGPLPDELARLTCPACGIKYMEFRAKGRLGCPHDYSVFQAPLEPVLLRIHRADRHQGKAPRRGRLSAEAQAERLELRRQLQAAIESENYEQAAQLRNVLREKEAADDAG